MERLDLRTRERIMRALDRLAETSYGDVKRIQGQEREWRLRVGDWRVRLSFESDTGIIRLFRVRHRREAYR
ncbi:MAG: type II toxin-antitoxin system RelE/ParE family toxin [Chloroflexi bacterium]|nr:type II toxin-antitoxin system RelE/ParE family toxin [Chloroflexota bacterium]